jgi:signal peptidase
MTSLRATRRAGRVLITTLALLVAGSLGAAWLAGWKLHVVETGSMDPVIPKDALVLARPVAARDIAVGDVVGFPDQTGRERTILHRVVDVMDRGGTTFLRTQGDANQRPDAQPVSATAVESREVLAVPRLGSVARGLRGLTGWVVLAGVPLLLLVVAEVRRRRERPPAQPPEAAEAEPPIQRGIPLAPRVVPLERSEMVLHGRIRLARRATSPQPPCNWRLPGCGDGSEHDVRSSPGDGTLSWSPSRGGTAPSPAPLPT